MVGPDPPPRSGISESRSSEAPHPLPKCSSPGRQQSTSSQTEPVGMKRSLPGTQSGGAGDGDGQMSRSPDHPSHKPVKQPKMAQAVAAGSNNANDEAAPDKPSEDPQCVRHKEVWQSSQFDIRRLEGHSDLVTAVAFHGSQVISGSRDTTVKVWHVPTAREERNLCGHTGEVNCLEVIPEGSAKLLAPRLGCDEQEQFVASGSSDSSIIIWALLAGVSVRNIYTFSAVTSLIYLPLTDHLLSGSDGGKVQLWDPVSQESKQSLRGHCDRVTAIQAEAGRVFTASADGEVKVWEYPWNGKLHLLYASGWTNPGFGTVRCLAIHTETLYLGGDWPNLKLLQWQRGTLSRLANHLSESGFTDCLSNADDVLIASGYNTELGQGYLNVRSLQDCAYLGTISCPDLPRILCLATWRTTSGLHRWATGGEVLLVWEQLGPAAKNSSARRMSYYPSYDRQAVDSESEDSSEISDCEVGTIQGFARRDSWRDPKLQERDGSGAGGSWCRLV